MNAEGPLGPARSLYLHLPFCERRCDYCDFAIVVGGEGMQDEYVRALSIQLGWLAQSRPSRVPLETVYLGGGTPSLLRPELLERLLGEVGARFGLQAGAEVTLEANPQDLGPDQLARWLAAGVNRLSLGVQSLDDPTLRWLGRNHSAADAERALGLARESGLASVSCDVISTIPVQSTGRFLAGLGRILDFGPDHISCYELTVEPRTPLYRRVSRGEAPAPSEEAFLEQHRLAGELLRSRGIDQYEVSNHARPGHQSRHNLNYWRGGGYLAAGCAAHGFLGEVEVNQLGWSVPAAHSLRYWGLRAAATYVRASSKGPEQMLGGHEAVSPRQRSQERLMCGLRLVEGVELDSPERRAAALRLSRLGLLTLSAGRAAVTPRGMALADRLALELAAA